MIDFKFKKFFGPMPTSMLNANAISPMPMPEGPKKSGNTLLYVVGVSLIVIVGYEIYKCSQRKEEERRRIT